MLQIATLLLLLGVVGAGPGGGSIYPEGHWDRATKLTVDNFDATVKEKVDSGKTFFVRWIASEG
jgi:hypothetical protein